MFHPRKGMMMISGPKNNYRSLAFCARPLTGRWDPQRDPQRAPLGQDRDERCEAKLTAAAEARTALTRRRDGRCGDVGHEKKGPC